MGLFGTRSGCWKTLTWMATLGCVFPVSSPGFWLPKHREISARTLDRFTNPSLSPDERWSLVEASAATDLDEGGLFGGDYVAGFHFDNLDDLPAVLKNLQAVILLVQDNLSRMSKDPWGFGKILHAIQDFYTHSNYVPLYREYMIDHGALPGLIPSLEEVLLDAGGRYREFKQLLELRLRTGRYPNPPPPQVWVDDIYHGWPIGPGMNQDLFHRTYHRQAKEGAVYAGVWYVKLYLGDGESRRQLMALAQIVSRLSSGE